ncbi:helix-turn-helix domain-containing protein [Cyanobium sp. Morenito 9A2]|nr:helix-turn-helix domain-containing protein [Cyanobium sp. Morenito 9A2]
MQFTQLATGALSGDLVLGAIGPVQVLRVRARGALHASGAKPAGRQLICLDLTPGRRDDLLCSHGQWLPCDSLFGLRPHAEIHLSTAAGCDLAILSLDESRFHRWAEALGSPGLDRGLFEANWARIESRRFDGLRTSLRRLVNLAERHPQTLCQGPWSRLAAEDLVPLIIEALAHGSDHHGGLMRPPARIDLVKLVQRWMDEHPREPITLDALCRQVHASRRTLIQGFREHLGMGPMAYLKLLRLHGIRRQLLAADPSEILISALALEWGFLNHGHFSRDYRRLFGERPSATLSGGRGSR